MGRDGAINELLESSVPPNPQLPKTQARTSKVGTAGGLRSASPFLLFYRAQAPASTGTSFTRTPPPIPKLWLTHWGLSPRPGLSLEKRGVKLCGSVLRPQPRSGASDLTSPRPFPEACRFHKEKTKTQNFILKRIKKKNESLVERPHYGDGVAGTLGMLWGLFLSFLFGKQIRGNFCPATVSPSPPAPPPANATD